MRAARIQRDLARSCLAVALVGALLVGAGTPAARADDGPADTLKTLYRIALSAEMCGFAMAPRQADALGKSMNRALAESGLDADGADRLYRDVDTALEEEGWDKVCASNGQWARDYRALLAANTR